MNIRDWIETLDRTLQQNWLKLVIPLSALAITMAVGLAIKSLLFRGLRRWAGQMPTHARNALVQTFSGVANVWILILGLHIALESSDLPVRVAKLGSQAMIILWVLSLTVVAARLASNMVRYYGQQAAGELPITTLTENLAGLAVAIVGVMILLNLLGVPITPLLTALGVGGLAVALALQDTLSNLFAGFYMSLSGQVRPGDYIRLDGGQEGYVTDITWRSTTVRALSYNLIIIPNAKLAQAIVTNFHLPEKRMAVSIPVSVGYESDPDHVERVLLDEVRLAAGAVPGLRSDPEPSVRFNSFGDSALNFGVNCHIDEFVDQYLVQHELRKRILKRLRAEGISIPFPIRELYLHREAASGQE